MFKVEKGNPKWAEQIANEYSCPSFTSVLSGNSSGEIWVDNLENPCFALVYSIPVGGFSILGKFNNQEGYLLFKSFVEGELFRELKANDTSTFEFSVDLISIEEDILKLFDRYDINIEKELTYMREPILKEKTIDKAPNFDFWEVNQKCIANDFENKDFMFNRILEAWGSVEDYLKHGTGFIAVMNNKIISIILGTAYYDKKLAIDIETLEEYQNKGIATKLTELLINKCKNKNITAFWNCMKSNLASEKTAVRAGFNYIGERNFFYFDF